MEKQNQDTFKVRHLVGAFSLLGFIYLVFILLWQKSNTIHYIIDSFNTNNLGTNVSISVGVAIIMAVIAILLVKLTGTNKKKIKIKERNIYVKRNRSYCRANSFF
ncbi:hypothetical protein [Peribacillus glennii]|uniref:Uncharacterized protein n=1 Tax=Peribacillus glennii TaxID=2303991 RepID=A0A372LDJ1_9BACI|nr:hypothetical protein [Peribacillus glennii]RFU64102.1 hypothetical protein D0466_09190 [Peribacillus glennii]